MYVSIGKSTRANKKMMAVFYDEAKPSQSGSSVRTKKKIKTTHFGQATASDYTIHGDIARKMNYLARHKEREDWEDYMTAGALSRWVLWNKPSLTESIKDYMNRFKLREY